MQCIQEETVEPDTHHFILSYLILQEYKYISSRRISYFYSSPPQPHQFTILVHSIPAAPGSSISESVENYFKDLYPSTYLSHVVVRRTSKIQTLLVSTASDLTTPFLSITFPSNFLRNCTVISICETKLRRGRKNFPRNWGCRIETC